MKRDISLGNVNEVWTHFWAGSLDTHNLLDGDYIKNSPTLIKEAIEADEEGYNAMRIELMKKYNMVRKGKCLVNADRNREIAQLFWKEFEEKKGEFAFHVFKDKSFIFNKDQVNTIFNITWSIAGELSKKYNCPFKGFRFAINGGRSVNPKSASISTMNFLWKPANRSWEEVIERCLNSFAFYIFCYSDDESIHDFKYENGYNYKAFKNWYKERIHETIKDRFTYVYQFAA